jgi:hypothetical protein
MDGASGYVSIAPRRRQPVKEKASGRRRGWQERRNLNRAASCREAHELPGEGTSNASPHLASACRTDARWIGGKITITVAGKLSGCFYARTCSRAIEAIIRFLTLCRGAEIIRQNMLKGMDRPPVSSGSLP